MVEQYSITSNRESGFGRYDTVQEALRQIEEKDYQANLIAKGIPEARIRKYGFAFCGKKMLIGGVSEKGRRKIENESEYE